MARLGGLVVGSRRMCPTNRLRRVTTVSGLGLEIPVILLRV